MKRLFFLFFLLLATTGHARVDSTSVKYGFIDDDELRLISELEDIKFVKVIFSDTLLYGKKFFISIGEYKNGKMIREDSLGLTCIEKRIPFVVGGDTVEYVVNTCDRITFGKTSENFKINFAGKVRDDSLNLLINYPSFLIKRKLKAGRRYSLRPFQPYSKNGTRIPVNRKVPLFIYTPPYKIANGAYDYCVLDGNPVDAIYNTYRIEHFYIFFLEIK